MLIFPLTVHWYTKIKNKEKNTEFREIKSYWTKRLIKELNLNVSEFEFIDKTYEQPLSTNIHAKMRKAYTNEYLDCIIKEIKVVEGTNTDLKANDFIYALNFDLV